MKKVLPYAARSEGCAGVGLMRISTRSQRLNCFIRIPNFDELVSLELVTAITLVCTRSIPGMSGSLLAIGSILGAATPAIHV